MDLLATAGMGDLKELLVETSARCNFHCTFCIQKKRRVETEGLMSFSLFRKILDDVAENACLRKFYPYLNGEPLLNPELPEMIRYARACLPHTTIALTTNGSLLTRKKSRALIEAGVDWVRFSLYGLDDTEYNENTGTHVRYSEIEKNIKEFRDTKEELGKSGPHIVVQMLMKEGNPSKENAFRKEWSGVADELFLTDMHGWDGTAGITPPPFSYFTRPMERRPCIFPWMMLAVNWRGLASVCCADWRFRLNVGDFSRQGIVDIWNGEKIKSIRAAHLANDFSNDACRSCCVWKIGHRSGGKWMDHLSKPVKSHLMAGGPSMAPVNGIPEDGRADAAYGRRHC